MTNSARPTISPPQLEKLGLVLLRQCVAVLPAIRARSGLVRLATAKNERLV